MNCTYFIDHPSIYTQPRFLNQILWSVMCVFVCIKLEAQRRRTILPIRAMNLIKRSLITITFCGPCTVLTLNLAPSFCRYKPYAYIYIYVIIISIIHDSISTILSESKQYIIILNYTHTVIDRIN